MAEPQTKTKRTRIVSDVTARAQFEEVLQAVREQGESVVVERAGRSEAVIISIDDYREYRRLQNLEDTPNWAERMMALHQKIADEWQGGPIGDVDEMINHGQR